MIPSHGMRVRKVDGSTANRLVSLEKTDLVRLRFGVEVTHQHRREALDRSQLGDAVGDEVDLPEANHPTVELPAQVCVEDGHATTGCVDLGEQQRARLVAGGG